MKMTLTGTIVAKKATLEQVEKEPDYLDNLVIEYLDLTLEYVSFVSASEIMEDRKEYVVNRLGEIREALGMTAIKL